MIKVYLPVGIQACGKSTWSKEEVRKDPEGTVRICRDDLRNMMNGYHFSDGNEKLITAARDAIFVHALKRGKNVILDETNLNPRNFQDACRIVRSVGVEAMVMEKPFYVELEEALERNSKREGTARIPDDVIRTFWKKSGGKQHKFYNPKVEVIQPGHDDVEAIAVEQNPNLEKAIICDLDGTISLFNTRERKLHPGAHVRSPYDASNCDQDSPNVPVIEVVNNFYEKGYKIIFCSGREDMYRPQTETFLNTYTNVKYSLFMRKTGDQRKDSIIKKEIFEADIKDKYNILFVLDDRSSVVDLWRSIGLTCFQVAPGNF
jgi:predicted kinase